MVNVGQFALAAGTTSNGACDINDGGGYGTCTFAGTWALMPQGSGEGTGAKTASVIDIACSVGSGPGCECELSHVNHARLGAVGPGHSKNITSNQFAQGKCGGVGLAQHPRAPAPLARRVVVLDHSPIAGGVENEGKRYRSPGLALYGERVQAAGGNGIGAADVCIKRLRAPPNLYPGRRCNLAAPSDTKLPAIVHAPFSKLKPFK